MSLVCGAMVIGACGDAHKSGTSSPPFDAGGGTTAIDGSADVAGGASGVGNAAQGGSAGGAAMAGAGNAAGAEASTFYSLDELCPAIVPRICSLREDCCNLTGFGYSKVGCEATELAECQQNVDDVKAGLLTYDGTLVPACLSATEDLNAQCLVIAADIALILREVEPCADIFNGTLPEGGACSRSEQCAPYPDPDVFESCDDDTGLCQTIELLGLDEPCALSGPVLRLCDTGLFCDLSVVDASTSGTCRPATPENAPCDTTRFPDLECGLGFHCNDISGVCTRGLSGGSACNEDVECLSFNCDATGCEHPQTLVDQERCTG